MKTSSNKEVTTPMFTRKNYLLLIFSCLLIILGLFLMSGNGSTSSHFEPEIFSFRRIVLAPIVCLIGYLSVIVSILYAEKKGTVGTDFNEATTN